MLLIDIKNRFAKLLLRNKKVEVKVAYYTYTKCFYAYIRKEKTTIYFSKFLQWTNSINQDDGYWESEEVLVELLKSNGYIVLAD